MATVCAVHITEHTHSSTTPPPSSSPQSVFMSQLNFIFYLVLFLTSWIPQWFLHCCLLVVFFPLSEFGRVSKTSASLKLTSSYNVKSINWLSWELRIFVLKTLDCGLQKDFVYWLQALWKVSSMRCIREPIKNTSSLVASATIEKRVKYI